MALAAAVVISALGLLASASDVDGTVARYTPSAVFLSAAGLGLAAHRNVQRLFKTDRRTAPDLNIPAGPGLPGQHPGTSKRSFSGAMAAGPTAPVRPEPGRWRGWTGRHLTVLNMF